MKCGTGFSLWGLVLARTKTHRLEACATQSGGVRNQSRLKELQLLAAYMAETPPLGIVSNGVPPRYTSP
jgi:hypothetical protein